MHELTRLAFGCDRIIVRESLSYAGYPSARLLFDGMGYGHPPDSTAPALSDPRRGSSPFASTATILAKALGLQVTSIEPYREVAVTNRELTVAAGVIPAGPSSWYGVARPCAVSGLAGTTMRQLTFATAAAAGAAAVAVGAAAAAAVADALALGVAVAPAADC